MKVLSGLLVAGRLFHAVRRSNLQLAKKISFREASRFTAVAGSDDNDTSSSYTGLVTPAAVSEQAVSGNGIGWNTDIQPSTNLGAPNAFAQGFQQRSVKSSKKANAVVLANAVHAAQRIPQTMGGLSPTLTRDRMTFVNVTEEEETLEVCHYPRELGTFPSFFDSFKQSEAVGADLIFRRTRPIDQSRFDDTINTLKEGRKVVWYGHPGIGKSTEANFVLLEFLRHLADGEDSEWPTKVAHRVEGQLYLYTWNAAAGRVECDMLPGETLLDVAKFSRFWTNQKMATKKKPPVLFLELEENENDPLVSIPTFIAFAL